MPNAVSSGVALSFGLITSSVSVFSAVEARKSNVTVCTGLVAEHAPIKLKQSMNCECCGVVPYDRQRKAREVPEGLVLLTADDLREVTADAAEFKKKIAVRPHPAENVLDGTSWGDKAYYLVPAAGQGETYAALMHLVENHPELAFTCVWTPRTSQGTYRLTVREGALFMRELVKGDRLRECPTFDHTVLNPAYASMAEQVLGLDGVVTPFDLDEYADRGAEKLAAILATRAAVPVQDASGGTATPTGVPDLLAGLQQMLDAAPKAAPAKARKAKASA
jgi:non-homologous end joining protein Ku